MILRRLVASAVLLGLVAFAGAACGNADADPNAPDPSDKLTMPVPATLGGLAVVLDPKASEKLRKSAGKETYVRDGSVFALREGKELKAVLQVIRLTHDARTDEPAFRKKIACEAIGSCRAPIRAGDVLYYRGLVNQQAIYVWFIGKFMQTLVVRQEDLENIDIDTLLAQVLAVRPVRAA